jgi:hypothetical protein
LDGLLQLNQLKQSAKANSNGFAVAIAGTPQLFSITTL